MILFPAIDIYDQKAIRLTNGDYQRSVTYSHSPILVAKSFEKQGAEWLHCVDLNGAKDSDDEYVSPNQNLIKDLVAEVNIPIQLGGGIRSLKQIENWLTAGVARVVLGTAALEDWSFLAACCKHFHGQISLAVDVKDGALWTRGWLKKMDVTPLEAVKRGADYGVATAIVTDISRDGTMMGPNWQLAGSIANATSLPIVVSGGIGSLSDIAAISSYPQIAGIILGKSLYEGRFTLSAALSELESGG